MTDEDKILRIAEYVFLNKQKYTTEEIIDNLLINERDFDLFSDTFALDYADTTGAGKNGAPVWRLRVPGVQLYLELKRKNRQDFFNKVMVIATVVLAVATAIQAIKLFIS
jgi:hypothetical protein